MHIGLVGAGEMGLAMGGHIRDKGMQISVFDVSAERLALAAGRGMTTTGSLAELAKVADIFIVVVATDAQVVSVAEELADTARDGAVIVVAATINPETIIDLGPSLAKRGKRLVDAPVVYGAEGARLGTLLSLCGGAEEDIETVRPALMCYSRNVLRVGPLGAGEVAKSCNNLLHWIHCVANYETLLIAKRYGLDAQRMREVLLEAPGNNDTLRRWDTTRFTWQEKDMDITLEMAQRLGLMLPLSGQVDQIIKTLKAEDVKALLYGEEATYLGRTVRALPADRGGLS